MADTDSSVPKPHVYDLLNRLNASFARVHRNMAALEQVGIFDPLMMQVLNRHKNSAQERITTCSGPCAALKNATGIGSRSHPMSKIPNPKILNPNATRLKKGGFLILHSSITPARLGII